MGHEPLIDPALEIAPLPLPPLDAAGVAAIVVTSANAARRLPAGLLGLPVFAVGRATASAARAAGAGDVRAGGEDGRALEALVDRELPAGAGEVLHLAGEEVRPGIGEALWAAGRRYRCVTAYRAVPSAGLGAAARDALEAGRLGAALFFSPRTAAVWRGHVEAAGLAGRLAGVTAACLSGAVASELRALPWRALRVAAAPDRAALLRCLEGGV
jgi:uroporphyrinogen-III synthase